MSGIKVRCLVGLSNQSAFHRWPAHCAARMLLSDKLRCCGAGTNGCFDLRRRAFPLGGLASAEWSKCPCAMAWRARDSVAPLRWSPAGLLPASMWRLSAGVGRRHPVTIRKASLMAGSTNGVYEHQTGAQYSAVEWTRTDEFLCGGYKGVSRLETLCICTRWTGEHELMSCCAAVVNGCLDLRRRASALGGRASVEWSRCPGSMARRPVTIRKVSLMAGLLSLEWANRYYSCVLLRQQPLLHVLDASWKR